jgi:hypothetical protein
MDYNLPPTSALAHSLRMPTLQNLAKYFKALLRRFQQLQENSFDRETVYYEERRVEMKFGVLGWGYKIWKSRKFRRLNNTTVHEVDSDTCKRNTVGLGLSIGGSCGFWCRM